MKASDFLKSRWMELAKMKGAEKKVRKEFEGWVKSAKDTELVKRARQLCDYFHSGKASTTEKAIVIAVLFYLISPIDLIPDAIPIGGLLDDVSIAGIALDYILTTVDQKQGKGGKGKSKSKVGPILKAVRKALT